MKDGNVLKTAELTLQDFCDMQQLHKLWITGLKAAACLPSLWIIMVRGFPNPLA